MTRCPYCLTGRIADAECVECSASTQLRDGIPSTTEDRSTERYQTELQEIAAVDTETLDTVLSNVRNHYMDGSVIDRFFKTRTACWRVLVAPHLSGRGLIIGDHEEKVGFLASELLDETYTVDSDLLCLRAQRAVAEATAHCLNPVHSTLDTLPFPPEAFDTVIVDCRAADVSSYLDRLEPLVSEDGKIILLVDGWTREVGLTEPLGLGDVPDGAAERVSSALRGHSYGLRRAVHKGGFTLSEQYALLSTSRHENQRGFDVHSRDAHELLLSGSDKTASTTPLRIARILSRVALRVGAIRQCYPRYALVCRRRDDSNTSVSGDESGILLAGKNRSTVLDLGDGAIQRIRKVPNSHWQGELNERAQTVIESVNGPISKTLPEGELRRTAFGPERIERPVEGTPLDQTLDPTPESIDTHLSAVVDWLIEFQRTTTTEWVTKQPDEIKRELTEERIGITDPPEVEYTVEMPLVSSHGDFFGSNIYLDSGRVSGVIDWEWAKTNTNPITDFGFLLLQVANVTRGCFENGFSKLFLEQTDHSHVIYSHIHEYCSRTGIDTEAFSMYLCASYLGRCRDDLRTNRRLDIDWVDRIRFVWNNHGQIQSMLTDVDWTY